MNDREVEEVAMLMSRTEIINIDGLEEDKRIWKLETGNLTTLYLQIIF